MSVYLWKERWIKHGNLKPQSALVNTNRLTLQYSICSVPHSNVIILFIVERISIYIYSIYLLLFDKKSLVLSGG